MAMTNLVSAYMRNEIHEFEKLLRQNSHTVMGVGLGLVALGCARTHTR